ncbi:CDP-glycerol glycerophosphotransferase family protein [Leucobacter sp. PH1c]|uniref:bifunctional glycosyltransferase/CDP-glycerol:glycerophosphate glycerophosphotransferase n=1 Tax=Leucobacter sp. PH1c TaxID=1397278 RepID=UPI0004682703|nr:CDP-glycerol glycerophosphotransferase family protein [Leucobacter sp. PH1c]
MTHDSSAQVRVSTNERALSADSAPRLSLVIPCYNVETYLPVLLHSLDAQDCNPASVELLFVIDGSPDRSEQIIAEWMPRSQFAVSLIVQENRGVAGALNTGLERAQGEWVSFSGPDDELSPQYFSEIFGGILQFPEIDMFVTRLVRISQEGQVVPHPLDYKFANHDEPFVVDLASDPEMIHLAGGTIALRLSRVAETGVTHDETLRSGFEDAQLISQFLLRLPQAQYAIVPQAHYYYHSRADSIIATSSADYTHKLPLFETVYNRLLDEAGSTCPAWLANVILYDMYWVFRQYLRFRSSVFAMDDSTNQRFNSASREVLRRIGINHIRSFRVVNVPLDIRAAWEAAVDPELVTSIAVFRAHDPVRRLNKITFHSGAPEITVPISSRRKDRSRAFTTSRELHYFGETWVFENIYWITDALNSGDARDVKFSSREIEFYAGGAVFTTRDAGRALGKTPPRAGRPVLTPRADARTAAKRSARTQAIQERLLRTSYALAYRLGGVLGWRRQFANAWVLIDRNTQANDNAEALYRYLREARPDINAWFVIDQGTSDWARLKADGFRLVAHGSKKHFALMKEAQVLASSMIDHYIVQPFPKRFLEKTWSYSFLQHGVTKDLLHRWWNPKTVDHLVTATLPEHQSIAGSPSPYNLSEREVTLTGMPRHDRLFRLMAEAPLRREGTHRIVLMPTWRNYLLGENTGAERSQLDGFADSQFVTEWSRFLNGAYLSALAQRPDIEVVLLPHPGIDAHWQDLVVPPGVRRVSYVGDDVQEILAGATLVVTDYSSQAFEGAFCNAPSVYFQFDREEFFSGGHIGSPGYFDYIRDGFGPVCEERATLEQALEEMISGTHAELPTYRRRIARLYPLRDGKASARIVGEIEARLRPYGS